MQIRGSVESVWKIQRALEAAGIEFIPAEAGKGPGVRLKRADEEPKASLQVKRLKSQPEMNRWGRHPLGLRRKGDRLDHKRVTPVAAPVILKKKEHLQGLRERMHERCLVACQLAEYVVVRPILNKGIAQGSNLYNLFG